MASRSPASSSTARCWPTSPCAIPRPSADSSTPPARRRLPDQHEPTHTDLTGAASSPGRRPFSFQMTITSAHNDKLKEIRKLARRRSRDERGRFVAEGEDLVAAAWAAGWNAVTVLSAAGSGLDGEPVEPALLAGVSSLGSGTRQLGVFEERWAAPAGSLCVALWGVGDP